MPPSRIDELRRRVQSDPASIAFAQLAEEYRRAGQTEEAVRVCREGLTRHPGYLSARVTLGRALLDLGQLQGARGELAFVVAEAPENLAAVRGLAEISHREGSTAEALTYYQRALTLARHDPEIEEIVQQLSRQLGAAATDSPSGLSFEEAHQELLSAGDRVPLAPPSVMPDRNADHGSTAPFDFDRLVAALGSPAAPPQTEAAVAGRPSTAPLEWAEPAAIGPDPFAALEAELRASEAAQPAPPAERVAPWSPPDTDMPDDADTPDLDLGLGLAPGPYGIASAQASQSAEEVLADTLLSDAPIEAPAELGHATPMPDALLSDPFFARADNARDDNAGADNAAADHAGDDSARDDSARDDDSAPPPEEPAGAEAAAALLAAPAGADGHVAHEADAAEEPAPAPAAPSPDVHEATDAGEGAPDGGAHVAAVEIVQLTESVVPDVESEPPAATPSGDTAAGLATQGPGESAGVPEPEQPAPAASAATAAHGPAAPAEGVLDELESWLTTLQDRSSR